jgi:hypothetical protein
MIAIYAYKSDTEAADIRSDLLRHGIPCILIGPEYGHGSLMTRIPFVIFSRSCEEIAHGFRELLPTARVFSSCDAVHADALKKRLRTVYGMDYGNLSRGGIRFINDVFYFYGNPIPLTDLETSIVKLLTICHGNYFTAEEIAAFCLEHGGAGTVPVHISHINGKNKASRNDRIIESRRYCGYRVP